MKRTTTGDENYDAILSRVDELKREHGYSLFDKPRLQNISMEMGDVRVSISFEHIAGRVHAKAA